MHCLALAFCVLLPVAQEGTNGAPVKESEPHPTLEIIREIEALAGQVRSEEVRSAIQAVLDRWRKMPDEAWNVSPAGEKDVMLFCDMRAKGVLLAILRARNIDWDLKQVLLENGASAFGVVDLPALLAATLNTTEIMKYKGTWYLGDWETAAMLSQVISTILGIEHVKLECPYTKAERDVFWGERTTDGYVETEKEEEEDRQKRERTAAELQVRGRKTVLDWWANAIDRAKKSGSLLQETDLAIRDASQGKQLHVVTRKDPIVKFDRKKPPPEEFHPAKPTPGVGDAFIDFQLKDADGKEARTADLRKGKVLVVRFGSTDDDRDKEVEHRVLLVSKAVENYAADKVVALAVDVGFYGFDESEAKEKIVEYTKRHNLKYQTVVDSHKDGGVSGQYHVRYIPDVLVVGLDGKIVYRGCPESFEELRQVIDRALAVTKNDADEGRSVEPKK